MDETVRLLFYSDKDEERLERLKSLNSRFATYFGSPISFIVKEHVIVDMLKVIGLHSYEVAFLSCEHDNIVIIQGLPIATIYYTQYPSMNYDKAAKLADFYISSINELNSIIKNEYKGYYSEVESVVFDKGSRLSYRTASF
ncbi:MAG: hypothetical protein GX166_13440 [Clostridiaceae bacterium]|nr:hypothetical protein [Clostridiaceae bacterium]